MNGQIDTQRPGMPQIPGREVEMIATGITQLAATIIDECDGKFSSEEKLGAYIHARDIIGDVMRYTARYDHEKPDLISLDQCLDMLRRMLIGAGIVKSDDVH
jgi:hypothetical protein